jgi:hypothetical protein
MTTQNAAPTRPEADDAYPHSPADQRDNLDVEVTENGEFDSDIRTYAQQKVRAASRHCDAPILRAWVRLTRYTDPALPRPVVSRATINVNGRFVRVQTVAASPRAGLDALERDLRKALGGAVIAPAVRSGGALPANQARCTVDEAIATLDALGRPFQLFCDVDTEEDTVVYRAGPTGYRLAQRRHRPLGRRPATAISVEIEPAPLLSTADAAQRLAAGSRPFLFFADPATSRGAVTYVARDGHVGLVTLPL